VGELISFASFDIPNETNFQGQTTDVSYFEWDKNKEIFIF
jgi:hypothetical protein